jgi:hypothetical protein
LHKNGDFCRGTIHSSKKFILKSILFTPAKVREMPRGTQRCVVKYDHNMLSVGWIDNKAVHFVLIRTTTNIWVVWIAMDSFFYSYVTQDSQMPEFTTT